MSNSSSRSVWSFIIKVIITVATAVGGLIGVQSCYHFYITRDGEIHPGRPLEKIGAHCRNHNAHSIGICYEGGLDANGQAKDTRTLAQRGALLALLRELKKKFPEALIVGHHDLNPMKECPCYPCVEEYREL